MFFLLLLSLQSIFAQKKIVLEKIRCLSVNGPVMNYWKDENIRKTVASQLSRILLQQQQMALTDTAKLTIQFLENNDNTALRGIKPDFTDLDTTHLHLYIDFFEVNPAAFFSFQENAPADSNMLKRAKSVFMINAWLLRPDKTVFLNEKLNVIVSESITPGIGIIYGNGIHYGELVVTPKGFTELFRAAANLLFDQKNEIATVEMKAAPAYLADNFILPKTTDLPRVYVATNKNVSTFHYLNNGEMIRLGEPVYEEIKIKGKKPEKYPELLTYAIKAANNFFHSDFVFLRQECRDVIRDKNYLVKLTTQVDPDNPPSNGNLSMFTNFLPGNFHYLFLGDDTLARFSIAKRVVATNNKIFADKVSNGVDSASFFAIDPTQSESAVIYDYIVTGKISSHDFEIKCSGFTNTIKEISLDGKPACIAQGKFNPEKFVWLIPVSPELLNPLLMIGFNRFFE